MDYALKRFALLIFLLLPACAVKHQSMGALIQTPVLTGEAFNAADGRNHALSVWAPEDNPWAVVVAVHGFNDYRHAFAGPGAWFAGQGVLVLAYDQRGFGADENAGYWAKKEVLADDLETVLALVREKYPGVPLFVMGESMGGAVALYTLAGNAGAADGLILVAPAVWGWRPMNIFTKPVLWLTAHIMPGKKFSGKGLKREPSDNTEALIALSEDPYVIKKTRSDAIYGLAGIMKHGMKAAPEIRLPTLLAYGEQDDLVPGKMFRRLYDQLPENLRTRNIYPDGYHLLLRDCMAGVVWRDILEFIGAEAGRELALDAPADLCQPPLSSE